MGYGKVWTQFKLVQYDVGGKNATKGDLKLTGEEIERARADGWDIKPGSVYTMAMGVPDRLSNIADFPYTPMVLGKTNEIEKAKKFACYQNVLSQLKKMKLDDNEIRQLLYDINCFTDCSNEQSNVDFSKIKIDRLQNTVTTTHTYGDTKTTVVYKYNNGKKVSTERITTDNDNNTTKTVYKFHYNPIKSYDSFFSGCNADGDIVKEWTEEIIYQNGQKKSVNNFVGIGDQVLSWGPWDRKYLSLISGKTYDDKGKVIDTYPRKGDDGKLIIGDNERAAYICTRPVKRYEKKMKIEIGKVSFYNSEVLSTSTRIDENHGKPLINVVETTFGTFEFRDDESCHQEGNTSILSGNVTNALLWTYKGTDNRDTLTLKTSLILKADTRDNKADVIYLDNKSRFGLFNDDEYLQTDKHLDKVNQRK